MKSKKKRNQEIKKSEKEYKKYNHLLRKPKKTRKLQKKNECELNKKKRSSENKMNHIEK